MPVLSTVGGASLRAFGAFRATLGSSFIVASGGTIYLDPNDSEVRIHQFTSDAIFQVTSAPFAATIELMMVGGGGGGAYGGGGGGGYIYRPSFSIGTGFYSVSIGSGGIFGTNGGDTTFGGLIALGGGTINSSGGSGGGGVEQAGGAGLQPTSASGGLGLNGGIGVSPGNDGGGGGATGQGVYGMGGFGKNPDIPNDLQSFEEFSIGGYGNNNFESSASPSVVLNSGNGGWGGGYGGVPFGDGQAGIVRIRYKFK